MFKNSHAQSLAEDLRDSGCFSERLLKSLPSLNAFAIALCGNKDAATDLVQETVLKALERQGSFWKDAQIRPWLFTILRNTYLSERRKRGRETPYDADAHDGLAMVAATQHLRIELKEMELAVRALPISQREALLLVVVEGFSYEEAAAICGCVVGTIKSRLNRARQRLAAILRSDKAAPDHARYRCNDIALQA